jgi:hypothetical protein
MILFYDHNYCLKCNSKNILVKIINPEKIELYSKYEIIVNSEDILNNKLDDKINSIFSKIYNDVLNNNINGIDLSLSQDLKIINVNFYCNDCRFEYEKELKINYLIYYLKEYLINQQRQYSIESINKKLNIDITEIYHKYVYYTWQEVFLDIIKDLDINDYNNIIKLENAISEIKNVNEPGGMGSGGFDLSLLLFDFIKTLIFTIIYEVSKYGLKKVITKFNSPKIKNKIKKDAKLFLTNKMKNNFNENNIGYDDMMYIISTMNKKDKNIVLKKLTAQYADLQRKELLKILAKKT